MKKILLCIITLTLLLCFVACETSSESTNTKRTNNYAKNTTKFNGTLTDSIAFSLFTEYMVENMSKLNSAAKRYDSEIQYVDNIDIGSLSVYKYIGENSYKITANGNFYAINSYGRYTGHYNFTWSVDIVYNSSDNWQKNNWSASKIQISD